MNGRNSRQVDYVADEDPTFPHKQALGDGGNEKLPFNGKKPQAEVGSRWAVICLGEDCKF